MSNFIGGHYFFTALVPVRLGTVEDAVSGAHVSYEQALRIELASLPTALQSSTNLEIGINSPFVGNLRTHFARFAVINDVVYNGRDPRDAIISALKNEDPVQPRFVDRLTSPFLLVSLNFDAANGSQAERDAYFSELWLSMEAELRAVFQHCVGFEKVDDAASFCAYMAKCQIETKFALNDYWVTDPPSPVIPGSFWGKMFILTVFFGVISLSLWLLLCGLHYLGVDMDGWLIVNWFPSWLSWVVLGLGALSIAAFLLGLAYKGKIQFLDSSLKAPHSDLKSILKGLYLQQRFVEFAIANQGKGAEALYENFGAFLKKHRPSEHDKATQRPGVIRTNVGEKRDDEKFKPR